MVCIATKGSGITYYDMKTPYDGILPQIKGKFYNAVKKSSRLSFIVCSIS